jgi:hypothetical protein
MHCCTRPIAINRPNTTTSQGAQRWADILVDTDQQSQTAPWEAAQPMLQGILGQLSTGLNNTGLTAAETGALNTLQSNAAREIHMPGRSVDMRSRS